MSALNPVPSSAPSTEKRAYEPSMEEILASIRRIIADDQSLPGRSHSMREPDASAEAPHAEAPASATLPIETPYEMRTAPIAPEADELPPHGGHAGSHLPPSHEPPAADIPSSRIRWTETEPESEPFHPGHRPAAHGPVAAPQYAGLDGSTVFERATEEPARQRGDAAEPLQTAQASAPSEVLDERGHEPDYELEPSSEAFDEPIEPPVLHEPVPQTSPLFSAATDSSVSSAFNVLAASRLAANSDEIMTLVRELIRPLLRSWLDDNLPSMVERMVRDEIERVSRGGR